MMIGACHLSDIDRFDVVNGSIVLAVFLAALTPKLIVPKTLLLALVVMFWRDAALMHGIFVGTRRISPGIELEYLSISWLSALVLVASLAMVSVKWARRCLGHWGRPEAR